VDKFKEVLPAMQEMIPINIILGDRSYRIRVHPKDEEVVRKAVKTINDKVIEFREPENTIGSAWFNKGNA